jgi:hypothetical protein
MASLARVRLIRIPTPRDLEYFVRRYMKLNGVYEVPLEVAKDLIEFGYASPDDSAASVSDFGDELAGDPQKHDSES